MVIEVMYGYHIKKTDPAVLQYATVRWIWKYDAHNNHVGLKNFKI